MFCFLFCYHTFIIFAQEVDSKPKKLDSTKIEKHESTSNIFFILNTNLGSNFQSISKAGNEETSAVWLCTLNSKLGFDLGLVHFYTSFFLNFGQTHRQEAFPVKNQDDFIISLTPSFTIEQSSDLRIFLDITAETDLKEGKIDNQTTGFFDPAYLNNTLYIGKMKNQIYPDASKFHLFYGAGYTFQSTITDQFILVGNRIPKNPDNPFSLVQDKVTFESGLAMIFDIDFVEHLGKSLTYNLGWKNVIYTKSDFWTDISQIRMSSMLATSIKYKFVSLNYIGKFLFDGNASSTRQINQSLVFGLSFGL